MRLPSAVLLVGLLVMSPYVLGPLLAVPTRLTLRMSRLLLTRWNRARFPGGLVIPRTCRPPPPAPSSLSVVLLQVGVMTILAKTG